MQLKQSETNITENGQSEKNTCKIEIDDHRNLEIITYACVHARKKIERFFPLVASAAGNTFVDCFVLIRSYF